MSTVYDLARVAGVSAATVSRIISRSVLVDQDPRERMLGMFCFVTGPKDVPDARERQAAFVEAVLAGHDRIIQRVRSRQLSEGSGTAVAQVMLGRGSMPGAIVRVNDRMAISVLRGLQQARIRCTGTYSERRTTAFPWKEKCHAETSQRANAAGKEADGLRRRSYRARSGGGIPHAQRGYPG